MLLQCAGDPTAATAQHPITISHLRITDMDPTPLKRSHLDSWSKARIGRRVRVVHSGSHSQGCEKGAQPKLGWNGSTHAWVGVRAPAKS